MSTASTPPLTTDCGSGVSDSTPSEWVASDVDASAADVVESREHALIVASPKSPKRKRAAADDVEKEETPVREKRVKRESKKALTIVINAARASVDAARKRWFSRHSDLFIPLLPASSVLLDTVRKDVENSPDKGVYTPLHELDEQLKLVQGGTMKDYQLHGLSFLVWMYKNGMNCILGDEMGLGKTLQTLSLFAYVKENVTGKQDPHLVVCPLSVLPSWLAEAARWIPSFKTLRFHGQQSERKRLKEAIRYDEIKFDICITTYEAYVAEESWFKSRRWTYCVLDEGHKIKNTDTNISSKLQGIGSLYRLILTGTPVQNNLVELWSILHWLYPALFTAASERLFKDSFDLTRGVYSLVFLKSAERLLSTIMLRRTKATVELSVPPREELTVFVPMTEAQRFWTYRFLTKLDAVDLKDIFPAKSENDALDKGRREVHAQLAAHVKDNSSGARWKKLMNLLMQLRKICDHPYLIDDAEPTPYSIGEHLVASSSKLMLLDKLLADILPKGERVLIFSQFTGMLNLLEDLMILRDIPYARLDGSTTRPRRTLDIKLFQQEHSPYQVFLVSTRAGGLGINLTKATTVIMVDSDWNPQNDLQAIARAHRIGQTKVVKVYRLICRGSVEDQMLDRIRRKLFLSVKVMGSDSASQDEQNSTLKMSELMDILRKGSSALSCNINGMDLPRFLKAPIAEILDASRENDDVRAAKLKRQEGADESEVDQRLLADAEEEERKLLSGVAQVQSRLFEGKVIERPKHASNVEIAEEWRELQKRSRVDRIVKVDGMEMIADYMGPIASSSGHEKLASAPKKSRKKWEHEDWCIYCRDGGELVLCATCPRVFHGACQGLTKAEVRRAPTLACGQHVCASCSRNTADAGGMIFRCRTCPNAFCEDCLPPDDLNAVGDVLPEFQMLGYGAKGAAYYIYCAECVTHRKENPKWWKEWEKEFAHAERQVTEMSR